MKVPPLERENGVGAQNDPVTPQRYVENETKE